LDRDSNVKMWNPAAERIFGWNQEETVGKKTPIVPTERREEARSFFRRVIEGQDVPAIETVRKRKDGSAIDVRISAAPLRDSKDQITGIMALISDITERKRIERE